MLLQSVSVNRDLEHFRAFDITLKPSSSTLPKFIDGMFAAHFTDMKEKKARLHLGVIIANLYAAWADDQTLCLAISTHANDYRAKSRYNPVGVSDVAPKFYPA
ncbi:hypothetical protein [Breoghania sp.]|uniref:hypothetical protein n=1 Tax=Breoghania sp. TaxID=2065378 RepID=UPI002AA8F454|nr:hypothetical protein [Breoghania sp.]